MKIQQKIVFLTSTLLILLTTKLLPNSSTTVVVLAFEDFEGEEEDCPSHVEEEVDVEDEEAKAEYAKEIEKARVALGEWPEKCADTFSACEEKIEDYKAIIEHEQDMLYTRVDKTIAVADEKMEITNKLKQEIKLIKRSLEESRSTVESATKDLEASKMSIEEAERSLLECNTSSSATIKDLEAKIASAKIRSTEYKNRRFIFNMDAIKSDIKGFLKKHGLVKDEL